jgi:hypothetical protein
MAGFGSLSIGEVTDGQTIDVIVVTPGSQNMLSGVVPPFYTRQPQPDAPRHRRRWGRRA